MEENKNDIIEKIMVKVLTGEATSEEIILLEDWRAASNENNKAFEDAVKVLNLSSDYISNPQSEKLAINVDSEWQKFVDTIESRKVKTVDFKHGIKSNYFSFYRMAAAILILFVAGFSIYYFGFRNALVENQTAELAQEIILPDQSVVTLNRFSKISYSKDFGEDDRTIKLTGEGFFDITPDKDKPFVIETNISEIRVFGTSFNVKAFENSAETEVIVSTGIVQLSSNETHESIKLKPGEKGLLELNTNSLKSVPNENINFNSWKTKKLVFDRTDLFTVVETLNQVYNEKVWIRAGLNPNCEVTVTFDQQSLDAVLNVLKSTLDLNIEQSENEIIIIEAGC